MWWIAAGSIFNISDTVAGKSPLTSSWSQITYGQTNIKIFTVHVLLLKNKTWTVCLCHLATNSPIPVTVHSPKWNVLLCFKKAAFVPPQVQVLLVDSASKPSRCSPGNNPILVQTDLGVKMLLSPSLWKTCECFLFPPQPCSSQTGKQLLQEEAALGAPWSMLEFRLFPTWSQELRDVLGAAPPWHKQLLQTLGKPLLLGIDISGRLTDKTSKTFHSESSFHSLLLENTN